MPVKYQCPKCEKRFVDWGAEKLSFCCPYCNGAPLFRLGAPEEGAARPPSLKRSHARTKKLVEKVVVSSLDMDSPDEKEEVEETEVETEVETEDLALVTEEDEEGAAGVAAAEPAGEEEEEEDIPEDLEFDNDIPTEGAVEELEGSA